MIFCPMSEGNKYRLFWGIRINNQLNGKLLNIIACLNSDVHEATNPVIEGTPM